MSAFGLPPPPPSADVLNEWPLSSVFSQSDGELTISLEERGETAAPMAAWGRFCATATFTCGTSPLTGKGATAQSDSLIFRRVQIKIDCDITVLLISYNHCSIYLWDQLIASFCLKGYRHYWILWLPWDRAQTVMKSNKLQNQIRLHHQNMT